VFVSTCKKESIESGHTRVTCKCICDDSCVCMTDVSDVVNIVNRGCDISFFVTRRHGRPLTNEFLVLQMECKIIKNILAKLCCREGYLLCFLTKQYFTNI